MQVIGIGPREILEEAARMYPVTGLGELTLPEWAELIGWAEAKANAALNAAAAGDAPVDPNEPPF